VLPLRDLCAVAARLRDIGHGDVVSYSRKVFIPLTKLCRDVCGYCTFARAPQRGVPAYLSADEVVAIARAGAAAGCTEALFTLGDKPEYRFEAARVMLRELGHANTISYLAEMCALVLRETGLLPHVNPGVLTEDEIDVLRRVSVSQGIMLETVSARLGEPGGPHYGSPDKVPDVRLATIAAAGRRSVPFTTGILIGIGETRAERIDSLLALRALHDEYGHLQEIIVQNFRAKPRTAMAHHAEPDLDELRWSIALTRLVFGPHMNVQAPPNLTPNDRSTLIAAGINDWGGVSPVTPDHVNPEACWPQIERLHAETAGAGKRLVQRLPVYPAFVCDAQRWFDADLIGPVLRAAQSDAFARESPWSPGTLQPLPSYTNRAPSFRSRAVGRALDRAANGQRLSVDEIEQLFAARDDDFHAVCDGADMLRRGVSGEAVSYVVTRNINYTNICSFKCAFCAFSKGKLAETLRGPAYDLDLDEIARRVREAWDRGATEVCMQGGIHPRYTGATYLSILAAAKQAVPAMHVHAFSPLEVTHGAATLGISTGAFLDRLKGAGLGSLPGTAAEVLDDGVRAIICPDKVTTAQWLDVVASAHERGIPTTSTIMFGHVEAPRSWANHLLALRDLQARTGGFTEFVPLPFVHMEAPIYLRGRARRGPTFRETLLMHAVARLVLHPLITNVQTSWVKLGAGGAAACLRAGANDLGGTLMNESISRAAGTEHGQEFAPAQMESLIRSLGRMPRRRTTTYADATVERYDAAFGARDLEPLVLGVRS
jgi:FO synthase